MISGRTELIIGPSEAKKCKESFAEVHLFASRPNPDEISKQNGFPRPTHVRKKMFDVEK